MSFCMRAYLNPYTMYEPGAQPQNEAPLPLPNRDPQATEISAKSGMLVPFWSSSPARPRRRVRSAVLSNIGVIERIRSKNDFNRLRKCQDSTELPAVKSAMTSHAFGAMGIQASSARIVQRFGRQADRLGRGRFAVKIPTFLWLGVLQHNTQHDCLYGLVVRSKPSLALCESSRPSGDPDNSTFSRPSGLHTRITKPRRVDENLSGPSNYEQIQCNYSDRDIK